MFSIIHLVLLTSVLKNVYLERKVVKKIANMQNQMKSPIVLLVEQQKRRKILKRRRNRMLRQSWTVGSRRKKRMR